MVQGTLQVHRCAPCIHMSRALPLVLYVAGACYMVAKQVK
jgi:hypothetical protein